MTLAPTGIAAAVTIWQTFRDAYSSSVIFGKSSVDEAFKGASEKITGLAGQS